MDTNRIHTHRSAASDLYDYGLAGIELNRKAERRDAARQQEAIGTTTGTLGRMTAVRQRIGDAMIRLGTGIAGEAATSPRVEPRPHPRVDMA